MIHHSSPHYKKLLSVPAITKPNRATTLSRIYVIVASTLLLITTTFWATLAAQIHIHNADQLIDPYLFSNSDTFQAALFPGQHSFLIKWPLFYVVRLFDSTATAFTTVTVLITLLTVGLLAFLLYRIERRPVVIGTLYLALASVLLLVPAEPYPGALLPVNFAMLANRNIEYIVYIVVLILITKTSRLRSWRTLLSVLVLGLLIASDKLFLTLSIGGSLISFVAYLIAKQRRYVLMATRWLVISLAAALLAFGLLWLITRLGITHIINEGSTVGPYAFTHTLKDFIIGTVYGILGLFTNLGANPVYDVLIVADLPLQLLHRLVSAEGVAYLVNLLIVLIGLFAGYRLIYQSIRTQPISLTKKKKHVIVGDKSLQLSLMLIATTLAALLLFVVSNHYYPVDARYLTIVTFAVFIVIATYIRRIKFSRSTITASAIILACTMLIGIGSVWSSYQRSMAQLSDMNDRTNQVAAALDQHPVDSLLGDYWRVTPIKLASAKQQSILPLTDCTTPRTSLTSKAWQLDLSHHSFAYLLSLEKSTTGYPGCTINQVTTSYGRPNSSVLIAGSAANPKEVLLFYDHGINVSKRAYNLLDSILPQQITQNNVSHCDKSTIMNIVAHQDDDLLFMNPDLLHSIRNGACIRSVYLTAGDSGGSSLYWLGREEGTKAAYAKMLDIANPTWNTRTTTLSGAEYATISKLKDSSQISLIFLHLPDGNINGQGFPSTKRESLMKLATGAIPHINTVDGQSQYTSDELTNGLVTLMKSFNPTEIHTQATHNLSVKFPDHSDHLAAGLYAKKAYDIYTQHNAVIPIDFYIGYPIRERPENISGQDLKDAEAIFFAYAHYDKGTCGSIESCSKMSYIYYLNRQYQVNL